MLQLLVGVILLPPHRPVCLVQSRKPSNLTMSKTLITFFILWFFLSGGFSQKVKLNDSTYLEFSEATRTKNEKLTQRKCYKVQVLFTGFFEKI